MPEINPSSPAETIRPVELADNSQVAELIRSVMTEFQCVGEGYSILDPEVEKIFESYNLDRHAFWVIESGSRILGCGGIGALPDSDPTICELKKMYFYPDLRGKGWGRRMVETCLNQAIQFGYETCYIETVERMTSAIQLYLKMGFEPLSQRVGNTGHCSCESFFAKSLK